MNSNEIKDLAAKTAYEVNRAYCLGLGDASHPAWEEAPDWQRKSMLKGVEGVLAGNGPKQIHAGWVDEKRATGWKYGPVKNLEKKEHPCFLPYDELPETQRVKDTLFVNTVKGVLMQHGAMAA